MYSRRRIFWAVAGACGAALLVVAVLPWLPAGFRDRADQIGSVLGGVSAVVGLPLAVLAVWALTNRAEAVAAAPEDPVERLAELVGRQWNREAVRRGLRGSTPMRIRWRVTGRPVAVPPGEVVDLGTARVTRLHLEGEVAGLVEAWQRLPYRRLVVIGRPGAGKTSAAVLFTCELLAGREPGGPVPVLLDLAGWRPSAERFEAWLGRSLAEGYNLRAIARRAGRLVADRSIVAVLDGFDEMPEGERAAALAGLNELVDLPLVLMSRAGEYEATVSGTGEPLAHALIVELDPLTAQQAARYLPGGQAGDAGRWTAVERHLVTEPEGPLAAALSNPLLAYLARTVYRRPDTDPAQMIGLAAAGELERHLFDGYLPALYGGPSAAGTAQRWLGHLARMLDRQSSADLAWWRIGWSGQRRVPAARLAAAVALSSPLVLLGFGFGGVRLLLFEGLAVGAAVTAFFTDVDEPPVEPRQVRFQGRSFVTTVAAGPALFLPLTGLPLLRPLLGGVGVAVLTVVLVVLAVWASRVMVRNLARAVVLLARAGKRRREVEIPDLTPNKPPLAFLLGQASVLLSGGGLDQPPGMSPGATAALGLGLALLYGLPVGVVVGLGTAFVRAAPRDELWDPQKSLRGDRFALLVPPLLVGVTAVVLAFPASAVGIWDTDWPPPHITGPLLGLMSVGIVWAMVIQFVGSAWFTYATVRLWLALRGRLPWRLMPFLADAARRGVLRRNGAVYQFRHERLRAYFQGTGGVRRP